MRYALFNDVFLQISLIFHQFNIAFAYRYIDFMPFIHAPILMSNIWDVKLLEEINLHWKIIRWFFTAIASICYIQCVSSLPSAIFSSIYKWIWWSMIIIIFLLFSCTICVHYSMSARSVGRPEVSVCNLHSWVLFFLGEASSQTLFFKSVKKQIKTAVECNKKINQHTNQNWSRHYRVRGNLKWTTAQTERFYYCYYLWVYAAVLNE